MDLYFRRSISPQRTTLHIKIPSGAFPSDFFRRPNSHQPKKHQREQSPRKNASPKKNSSYWQSMNEELEVGHQNFNKIQKFQRTVIFKDKRKKTRIKKDVSLSKNQQKVGDSSKVDGQDHEIKKSSEDMNFDFTFYKKSSRRHLNLMLPPLK